MKRSTCYPIAVSLAVLVPLLFATNCLAQQRQRAIPLGELAHLSTVPVMINGSGPFEFVFDTGAGINVLDVALVTELGVDVVGKMPIGSPMGADPLMADSLYIETLRLGDAAAYGLPGVALDLGALMAELGEIDGILSAASFDGFLVTADFTNRYVTVSEGALATADGRRILDYNAELGVVRFEVMVADIPTLATLDTGAASGLMLSSSLVENLPLLSEPVSVGQGRTVDATFEVMSSQLDGSLFIGNLEFENPEFTFTDRDNHALIGMEFVKDYTLTIDSANSRLSFGDPPSVRRVEGRSPESELGTPIHPSQGHRNSDGSGPANDLEEYVGTYGRGTVSQSGSRLFFRVEQMPTAVAIEMIGIDEFEIIIPEGALVRGAVDGEYPTIRFDRNSSGSIESLSVIDPDGSVREVAPRDGQ